jgi:predicted RNase H-like HicB family nuclease
MNSAPISELVFEVTQEADGGYVPECLTETIATRGDTWDELRANVKEAVAGYFFDGPKPRSIRLHLVRAEVLMMG